MATDAKLRLQITTALDAAGIKATRDQIDALSKTVADSNAKMGGGAGKLEQAIGEMPGKLGKVAKAMGGLVGKVSLLSGAFMTGYEIGNKISEQLAELWPAYAKFKDPMIELTRQQNALKRSLEASSKAFDEQMAVMKEADAAEERRAAHAIALIDKEAKARMDAAKMRGDLLSAGEDAELIKLERNRMMDKMEMRAGGASEEAIDQADKLYDVIKQQMEAKKQIAAFDRETAMQQAAQNAEAEKLNKTLEKTRTDTEREERIRRRISKLEASAQDSVTGEWTMKPEEYERRRKALDKALAAAEEKRANGMADIQADIVKASTTALGANELRASQRANLIAQLGMDEVNAHNAFLSAPDALGLNYSDEYRQQIADEFQRQSDAMEDARDANLEVVRKLDQLLQIKGGE